jgi:hypothetical protein
MNVLDIDLDFFVDPRPRQQAKSGRLSEMEYHTWSAQSVEEYLTRRCNLRKGCLLPGAVVTYHHELFDRWKTLIGSYELTKPFQLTHLDSHADMGMGFADNSCGYIMGELLHCELSDRQNPKRGENGGLLEGNFISFSLACRWISSIVYVHHPQLFAENCGLHDIPDCMFRENKPKCNVLQLKQLPPECQNSVRRLTEFVPISLEPEVPIRMVERDDFYSDDSYSFVFVAKSPRYTPKTADPILEVIRQFICSESEANPRLQQSRP